MIVLSEEIEKKFICKTEEKNFFKIYRKKIYWSSYELKSQAIKKKVEAQA